MVIFIRVIVLLVKHKKEMLTIKKKTIEVKEVVRLIISLAGIMFLFGLSWLFAALTITVQEIRQPAQVLFAIFNSLQGFFIFLFLCVFNKDARESWKQVQSCGRYKSDDLNPTMKSSKNSSFLHKDLSTKQLTSHSLSSYYLPKNSLSTDSCLTNKKSSLRNNLEINTLSGENSGRIGSNNNSEASYQERVAKKENLSTISSHEKNERNTLQEKDALMEQN